MENLVIGLLAWVVANTAYMEKLPQSPNLEYKTEKEMVAAVCPNYDCSTPRAYYGDGGNTVFLPEDFNRRRLTERGVLAHELVHYLQDLSGRWPEMTCVAWVVRESEAYRIQADYLVSEGAARSAINHPWLDIDDCKMKEEPRVAVRELSYGGQFSAETISPRVSRPTLDGTPNRLDR